MLRFRVAEALRRQVWLIPLTGVAAGCGLSFATVAIDRQVRSWSLPASVIGTSSDAQDVLMTIASAVVSLTTIVLTVTLVAVQLAMGQFSPRIVQALIADRGDQAAIGVFGATFSFALVSLHAVGASRSAPVPGLTVWTAIGLAVASGMALFFFIHHASRRLRVSGLVDLVGDQLREELARRYPARTAGADGGDDPATVTTGRSGNVIFVDHPGLIRAAREARCALELVPMMGDFVVKDAPLFRVIGDPSRLDGRRLRGLVAFGDERTHRDDPVYGFRKLVDVAQRSLGTAQNDATTAVQVINRLHDCLRQIAGRPFPSGRYCDAGGELRLIVHTISWDGYVRLAFDEIRLAAGAYPQATRRLVAALEDLKTVAPAGRQPPLDRQLRLLEQAVGHDLRSPDEIRAALVPDQQGIGSGPDLASCDGVFPDEPQALDFG